MNLSGSELYSSSDPESSEDDLVSSTEQLNMTSTHPEQSSMYDPTAQVSMHSIAVQDNQSEQASEEPACSKKRKTLDDHLHS